MKPLPTLFRRFASPRIPRSDRRWFSPALSTLLPLVVGLITITSAAQTPAPPAGGLPTADRLQQLHNLGQQLGGNSFDAETLGPELPKTSNLEYHLDNYMKDKGTGLSKTEREVFTEAFWQGVTNAKANPYEGGSLRKVEPDTADLQPQTSPTTTTVTGKTAMPEAGVLQLTDAKGKSYFVDVDKNGSYSITVPESNFQPTKMILRTATLKAAWRFTQNGAWEQVSTATGTGTQGAMVPGRGSALSADQQFALAQDECERYVLLASLSPGPHVSAERSQVVHSPLLLPVRFGAASRPVSPNQTSPLARLVGDPLPPEVVDQMNKLGKDIADYQHQKETLEKELRENKDAKTGKPLNRDEFKQRQTDLDNVKNKLKGAEQNKQFISDDARKVVEDAYNARKAQYALPGQIKQLRAKGDPASLQQADMMERQLQALNQFYGPIALAPIIVPPGQSGYALATAAASLGSGNTLQVVKGHTTQVATTDIRRQQETGIELDSLVHLEENEQSETVSFPAYFGYNLLTNRWGKPDLSLSATWTGSDSNPPIMASISSDGTFAIKDAYSLKACVKLNVAYGYDHVSTAINGAKLAGDYHVTFNRNPTWIAGFKTGVNIDQFQQDYMQGGALNHSQYTWTHWQTPFADVGMISSGQISDEGYNQLSWTKPYKDFMVYGELSPGTNPDPLPGLDPTDWPSAAAAPGPALSLPGIWLEEGAHR